MSISDALYKAMVSFSSSLSLLFLLLFPFLLSFLPPSLPLFLPPPLWLPLLPFLPPFLPSFLFLFLCVYVRERYLLSSQTEIPFKMELTEMSPKQCKEKGHCWQHNTSPITTSTLMEKHDSGKQGKYFN